MTEKQKVNNKVAPAKLIETIRVNQIKRKENFFECSQSNIEPKEHTIKLFNELITLNTFDHI